MNQSHLHCFSVLGAEEVQVSFGGDSEEDLFVGHEAACISKALMSISDQLADLNDIMQSVYKEQKNGRT